ncbi:unnamed protein product [Adineta steineri]|uniref:Uncharacterized protein n=1 Tax=Adineta steineri TaxID=433720 RepID=A0A819K9E8_9BILA|nr:unnamed protein product [Adineta steineri]CAF3942134.1 unnamed protein product [Adineta steineri]
MLPVQIINDVYVWQRKLSAVCRNATGVIKILNFNPAISINSLNENLSTISSLSQTLCILSSVSTIPEASGVANYGTTSLNTVTRVAVDGVMIFSLDSANNYDPLFPPTGAITEQVDNCLAHCHIGSGCQVSHPIGTITACAGVSACKSNLTTYSIS